jgi:DNA-binding PucR family transcriptional regulator
MLLAAWSDGAPFPKPSLGSLAEATTLAFPDSALLVIRHQTVTALLKGEDATSADRARLLIQLCAERFGATPYIGIGLATHGLERLGAAYEQAASALRLTSESTPVVALGTMPALDYLIAGADHIALSLVRPAARELARSTDATDVSLLQTLDAYLSSGLNIQQTAVALPAHPNTVHDRLKRLSMRTGCDPRNVDQLLELATEIRLSSER